MSIKITSLTPEQIAKFISSGNSKYTAAQVEQIAEQAGIIDSAGHINLLEYMAYIAREITDGY